MSPATNSVLGLAYPNLAACQSCRTGTVMHAAVSVPHGQRRRCRRWVCAGGTHLRRLRELQLLGCHVDADDAALGPHELRGDERVAACRSRVTRTRGCRGGIAAGDAGSMPPAPARAPASQLTHPCRSRGRARWRPSAAAAGGYRSRRSGPGRRDGHCAAGARPPRWSVEGRGELIVVIALSCVQEKCRHGLPGSPRPTSGTLKSSSRRSRSGPCRSTLKRPP